MKKCKKCGSATITGWDGVVKTSMAIERIQSDKMGVPMPPVPTKGHYQLYFGTPICSIPSHPPPATRHPPPATRHPPPAT
ncbi:MAG TPA: hypothetical protein PLL61_11400, partial [Thiobacillus sp.]|nr:hypothetical protein [Thiobacillus sp.]